LDGKLVAFIGARAVEDVAVMGIEVEASDTNLVGQWTNEGRTGSTFNADGTHVS
jgi:hypothetical protein